MSMVDMRMKAKTDAARAEVMNMALDIVEGYEAYVETHDDERAQRLKEQTRDNLCGCVFNEVMGRISGETKILAGKIDGICEDAADAYKYKTWYGAWELGRIDAEFHAAMKNQVLEFPVEPFQEIYRINDGGDYVDNAAFETYWEDKPKHEMIGWMLADNGQLTGADVAEMTYAEAKTFFDGNEFEPEVAFFTTADEEGCC